MLRVDQRNPRYRLREQLQRPTLSVEQVAQVSIETFESVQRGLVKPLIELVVFVDKEPCSDIVARSRGFERYSSTVDGGACLACIVFGTSTFSLSSTSRAVLALWNVANSTSAIVPLAGHEAGGSNHDLIDSLSSRIDAFGERVGGCCFWRFWDAEGLER
ncbi:hypothetical protein BKA70DRAFT_846279 [Coprinopsis sp. MPI-PUGE-AT-0042]|nr:hypothetical protein BKA70DRAFT_846279 [Coprinopsis sp. MPI-PUGE-AT-0042]